MWGKLMKSAIVVIVASLALAGCGSSEPEPEPTTVPGSAVEVTGPLSYEVWSTVVAGFPDGIDASSPLFAVTELADGATGSVRVLVQEALSDAERQTVGKQIFTLGAWDNTDLTTVIVRDASGGRLESLPARRPGHRAVKGPDGVTCPGHVPFVIPHARGVLWSHDEDS